MKKIIIILLISSSFSYVFNMKNDPKVQGKGQKPGSGRNAPCVPIDDVTNLTSKLSDLSVVTAIKKPKTVVAAIKKPERLTAEYLKELKALREEFDAMKQKLTELA